MTLPRGLEDLVPASAVALSGEKILAQISAEISGGNNQQLRPADVRLLLKTAPLDGQEYQFPNHGHPENELSTVAFDNQNAIVIMPAGATPRAQLFAANQIVAKLEASGLAYATPEFIEENIVNKKALTHRFAAQAYGPAPFDGQAARFVSTDIPGVDGGTETIAPKITDAYAVGMRAPTTEEAYLVLYAGKPQDMFLQGGDTAATYLSALEKTAKTQLAGEGTAAEVLDGLEHITQGIVIARDAATGRTKPIRLETAKDIFNLKQLPVVIIDRQGKVTGQYKPVGLSL